MENDLNTSSNPETGNVQDKGSEIQKPSPDPRVLLILWLAFVGAVAIYVIVAYLIPVSDYVFTPIGLPENAMFFGALALSILLSVAQIKLPSFLFKNPPKDEKDKLGRLFISSILRFALSEAPAIFGLILFFLYNSITHVWILCGIAIVNLIIAFPRSES